MLQYVWNTNLKDDEPVIFSAENQCWDKKTLKELKHKYDVVFMTSGDAVFPIMIINKDGQYPLLAIGTEDDGTIIFKRKNGHFLHTFSPYWVKSFVADLEEAAKICEK